MYKEGTVTISVDKYNQLRDFETNMMLKNHYSYRVLYGHGIIDWVTSDEAVVSLINDAKELSRQSSELNNNLETLRKEVDLLKKENKLLNKLNKKRFWFF
jgi:predicted transcriptional regulator